MPGATIRQSITTVFVLLVSTGLTLCGPGSTRAVQFDGLARLRVIGFPTGIAFGPEDPDPASSADGCIYAVHGPEGQVRRICFDAGKSVVSDAVVVDLNGTTGGTNMTLGIRPNQPDL